MTGKDIRNIALYIYNISIEEFARKVYGRPESSGLVDMYIEEKFEKARGNTLYWICSLDEDHCQRLADAVVEKYGE